MEEVEEYKNSLAAFQIPSSVSGLSREDVIAATKNDKKMDSGVIKFILLHSIGDAYTDRTVTDEEMGEALEYVLAR